MKKTAIVFSFLLALLAFGHRAWAQNYITDVMLIGHNDMTEFNNLYNSYTAQGWTGISYNLNDGINNAHCINLMYKSSENPSTGVDITDFYLRVSDSNDAPEALVHQTHIYFRADCDGSDLFKSSNGDLNCGAGGKFIHLYYTRFLSLPAKWSVVGISFDNSSTYSVAENGGSTPCDLNKGAGGSYIYMHVSKSMTGGRVVVHNEAELKDALLLDNANIQLGNDIATSSLLEITNSRTVTIDMNGFTLDRGCTSRGSQVIVIRTGSTLNLSNGTLTGGWGGNGGALDIETGTTVNLTDVIITGNTADDRGGGVSNSGTLTMTNCTLSGNTSRDNLENIGGGGLINYANCTATLTNVTIDGNIALYGGGLCNRGTLNMEGCTISNNLAYLYGGGIRNEGTLTMTDCTVADNECSNESILPVYDGGGIYNHGTLHINGCNITGNTCMANGSGIWNDTTLNIQGNVQIKDNDDDDIYLPTGSKITVTDTLTGGPGSIGVRMNSIGVFTQGYAAHNSETDHFFSDIIPNEIVMENGEAKMRYGYYECSWDSDSSQLVHTVKYIPDDVNIDNLCTSMFSNGGVLWGNDNWFVADGTGSTANGLTCSGSDIHIILCDGAEMTINEGLFVNEGTTLHVYCQSYGDRMGKLICNGASSQPGIGPKYDDDGTTHYSGHFDIHGGNIKATGGKYGAGIGGCEDRSSGTITIWDGKIEATGGTDAAGIGGGEGGSGTYTYIYGGKITATGVEYGAGIGGGERTGGGGGNGGHIEIFGGTIVASGTGIETRGGGAGIGSGDSGDQSSPIIIHGGVVTATGGYLAAGIGSGYGADAFDITINGGTVIANGGFFAAAIGGGCSTEYGGILYGAFARKITINGGFVSAIAHTPGTNLSMAAAIGGGKEGKGNIDINGGIVFASSDDGAAIGSGAEGPRSIVNITGGSVVAISLVGGAGIGGGREIRDDGYGYIHITGGEVMAMGGAHKNLMSHGSPYSASKFITYISKLLLLLRGSRPNAGLMDMLSTSIVQVLNVLTEINEEDHWGGAGIGGGYAEKNSDKWIITIEDGYVVAHGGRSGAEAIGHGYDSDDGSGTLTISQGIMVSAGSDENHYTPKTAANRVSACRNNQYVYMQPCGHKGADSYTDNGDGTYTINEESCHYCSIGGVQTLPHTFSEDGAWNDADKWSSGHVPIDGNDVVICAHCEVPADYVAKADTVSIPYYDTIFIKDGGQLFHSNAGVQAIAERTISTYSDADAKDHYHLIASPMATSLVPSDTIETNLLANDHDLYLFDQSETLEWRNYKANQEDFSIDNGIGYLYANDGDGTSNYTIKLMGELQPSNEDVSISPDYDSNAGFKGWNLVGNPFACDAYLNDASDESMAFYRMNDDGDGFIAATGAIHQLEGIFVQATAPDQSFNFSRTQDESSRRGNLFLDLYRANNRNANVMDNAIIRFGSANTLEKFYFNDRNAKLYIPQDGKDYAVVHAGKTGELPLNFKATENGEYTISMKPENVDMAYLHLIDNMTGADIDLLSPTRETVIAGEEPQYTFTAKTTDYESRFKLVFASVCEDADGDNETFAFNSNGNWIISDPSTGLGSSTLQLIDINGRILSSETINGSVNKAIDVAPGVYILKLNDKVQKIVIR